MKDKEFQSLLFGKELNMINATLEGYKIFSDSDGYYYLKECNDSNINGKIIEVSLNELRVADLWEEVPNYYRKLCKVLLRNGLRQEVYVYFKRNVNAEIEIDNRRISLNDRNHIIEEIGKLKKVINENSFPFSDVAVFYPCISNDVSNKNNSLMKKLIDNNNNDFLVKSMIDTVESEFNMELSDKIIRKYITKCYLKVGDYLQYADIYISCIEDLQVFVVLVNIPNSVVNPIDIIDCASSSSLTIIEKGKEYNISSWFQSIGIRISGTPRTTVFTPDTPCKRDLSNFLAGEKTEISLNIDQDTFVNPVNIGVYDSFEIYSSEKAMLVRQNNFSEDYLNRSRRQALTFFICELLLLQDAAKVLTNK